MMLVMASHDSHARRAFSLIEMMVVLLMAGLMVGFMLNVGQTSAPMNSGACNLSTKAQMAYIQAMMEKFARSKDRLPLPAARNVGVDSPMYGREASSAAYIDTAGGASWGALPFQALGLPVTYAGDCWGNKFTYVVTTALTTSNASGGFKDSTVLGNITLKSTTALNTNTAIAWAVISHGEDELGAVKLNYSKANASDGPPDSAHGWCSGGFLKHYNCLATSATLADGLYNNGKDAGNAYFDDIVIAAGKPKIISASNGYIYGWGLDSTHGLIGDGFEIMTRVPALTRFGINFSQIAFGFGYGCGLESGTGLAYCWGTNSSNVLGNGTSSNTNAPVAVSGGYTFTTITTGSAHACAIRSGTGAAYCWGDGSNGKIGDGFTTTRSSPVAVSGGLSFSTIVAGNNHTCALQSATGTAYCWGANNVGQLGDTSTTQRNTPTAVDGGRSYTSISTLYNTTCAIEAVTGNAYCWGSSNNYQIGDGFNTNRTSPTAVTMPGGVTFTTVSTSINHSCAIAATTNAAYCWGYNNYYQIGDGTNTTRSTPVAVSGSLQFSSLSTTESTTCGLTTDGAAYCWGANGFGSFGGQIGDNTSTTRSTPTAVHGGHIFSSIVTIKATLNSSNYSYFSCGLKASGVVYCWGHYSRFGEVVGKASWYTTAPRPAYSPGLLYSSLFNGGGQSIYGACAISSAGKPYCWGGGGTGEIGDGTLNDRATPYPTTTALQFSTVTNGSNYACGLTTAGAGYCWGSGTWGRNGIGTGSWTLSPTAIAGGRTYTAISAGDGHGCAVESGTGAAYCWGGAWNGRLGNNATAPNQNSPVAVNGGLSFSTIAAGNAHTCGITTAGAAYCWGSNSNGQLGDGSTTERLVPTAVNSPVGVTFSRISVGYNHSCAVSTTGAAYCWGYNNYGQVGDGSTTQRTSPVAVSGGLTFTKVFAAIIRGNEHYSCGLTSTGSVYCWGYNGSGQLGDGTTTNRTAPTLVSGGLTFIDLAVSKTALGLVASPPSTCTDLYSANVVPAGVVLRAYQSSAPTGPCVDEYRVCTAGAFTGSYTSQTCTPGCEARTITWNGAANGCTAAVGALAGGGSAVASDITGSPNGTVTVNCSTNGVVTLSGAACTP